MPPTSSAPPGLVRLQRLLAAAGVASRRACEELIEQGRVQVNGRQIKSLPAFVNPASDQVTVDGRPIRRQETRKIYVMLNKPARVLSTTADEPGLERTTIMDLVDHPAKPRLVPVGRLDFDTMGLVLLTNDTAMVNRLTHPRFGITKTYHATVKGTLDQVGCDLLQGKLNRMQRKDDKRVGKVAPSSGQRVELSILSRDAQNTVLAITLREGRTGNIAKMLTAVGAPVRKLERVAIGPIAMTGLARARWRELDRKEINALKNAARGNSDTEESPATKPVAGAAAPSAARPVRAKPRPPAPATPLMKPKPKHSTRTQRRRSRAALDQARPRPE